MRIFRIILALSLLPMASRLHNEAIATVDVAIDAPRTTSNPLPLDKAGDFFGEDPRVAVKTTKGRGLVLTAQLLDFTALACLVACPLLVVSAFVRRRTPQPQPELTCDSSASSPP